jgi:hypothetical protein
MGRTLVQVALRKPQRNEVFKAIEDAGLSPEEFGFEWATGADESSCRHVQSGARFVVRGVAGDYSTWWSAGDEPVWERAKLSWFRVMEQVRFWLSAVKQDVETPDLWAQVQRERELLAAVSADANDNTPFTAAEREEIAEQLRELKNYLMRRHTLSDEQVRLLDERLDYLADAAKRVGRKDWFLMAAGAMLSYVLAAALPPDAATHVLGTLLTSIGHILWGGHLPWGGPLGLSGGG